MVYKSMLHIRNINYEIGGKSILRDISISINKGEKYILMGNNGAGKTTLLKIISSVIDQDSGEISSPAGYSIGYLPQELIMNENRSILDIALEGKKEIAILSDKIKKIHDELIEIRKEEQAALLKQLEILEDKFLSNGGYNTESKARKILSGLGFSTEDFKKPADQFSGGWRMRAFLAGLLLKEPDLLLLDEPTNHLDIPSMEWLEQYLARFDGSAIIVTHDRYFIDKIKGKIIELDKGEIFHYSGNYENYEKERIRRVEIALKRSKDLSKEIKKQERFIERFRYKNTKASQVQSRIKMLEKIDRVEIEPDEHEIIFKIPSGSKSYKEVLKMENISFGYVPEEDVIRNSDLEIFRGEKAALIGLNGAGKTTTAKLISGQLRGFDGKITLGERVVVSHYSQILAETLDPDKNIYDEAVSIASDKLLPSARNILGLFGFRGDNIKKKTGYLSGGEKARVALAKLLLSPANFLIMDEPTTHLDRKAKVALTRALKLYEGTLILITHDRHLIDEIANHIIFLDRGRLKKFDGNYSYFASNHLDSFIQNRTEENVKKKNGTRMQGKKSKKQKREEAEARQAVSDELNSLKKNVSGTEKRIEVLEEQVESLKQQLADHSTYDDKTRTVVLQKEYYTINSELEILYKKWEELNRKIISIKKNLP